MKKFAPAICATIMFLMVLGIATSAYAGGAGQPPSGIGSAYYAASIGTAFGEVLPPSYVRRHRSKYRIESGTTSTFTARTADGGFWYCSVPTSAVKRWYVPLKTPIVIVNWGPDGQAESVTWIGSQRDWKPAPILPIGMG